ncbi:ATP-binding protein [Silvimonas amylolytica]|uniref:histidine kinase n=1 Tax=Silvimonas amylolytica TaxID=449663 RepID=A0ABQ2PPD5_9NEIS|nr:ATP-binding protein [Silvimonas amylolytica]GGP27492.1 two-component sensor histidine kinase [Silvimonas amylolytica]
MISIRRQLVASLLAVLCGAIALGAGITFYRSRQEANTLFDYQLRQMALALRDQSFARALPAPSNDRGDFDFVIQVWNERGIRIYMSHPNRVLPDQAQLGFSTVETRDGTWRAFSIPLGAEVIQVAQPMRIRNQLALMAAIRTSMPFLAMLPLLAVIGWLAVGRGLKPLEELAGMVAARTPTALEPIEDNRVPVEAGVLVNAINMLMTRLGRTLDAQRTFTADAAHELRTPLTALQLQLQLLERAGSDEERRAALKSLQSGLNRATHVLQQLLTLARAEPDNRNQNLSDIDLAELAGEVLADHLPLAEANALDIGLEPAASTAHVVADREAVRTMFANLIGNAIRYTPKGGQVDVSTGLTAQGQPVFKVCDSGPGIPAEEQERVFDRFYRRPGETAAGSGLGLAIVKTLAHKESARVVLGSSPLGGLAVEVIFTPKNQPA